MKVPLPNIEINDCNSKFCGEDCPYLNRIDSICLIFNSDLRYDDKDMEFIRCHICRAAIDVDN